MPPTLTPVFKTTVLVPQAKNIVIPTSYGSRVLEFISSGTFESVDPSHPFQGTVLPHGGGDFGEACPKAQDFNLTAQMVIKGDPQPGETEPEYIFMRYSGFFDSGAFYKREEASEEERKSIPQPYLITRPVFEVSSERLKWLERSVFIGYGSVVFKDGMEYMTYDIYRVGHSEADGKSKL